MTATHRLHDSRSARVFIKADWHLFKAMAELHLKRATSLRMADVA
jgi:hypothetical protein